MKSIPFHVLTGRTSALVTLAFALGIICASTYGVSVYQPNLSVAISHTELAAATPLHIFLTFQNFGEDGIPEPLDVKLHSRRNLDVQLLDSDHNVVKQELRPPLNLPYGFRFEIKLKPGETFVKTVIAHQWISTDLPEGRYFVRVQLQNLEYRYTANRDNNGEWSTIYPNPAEYLLPIMVTGRNDAAAREEYDSLLKIALNTGIDNEQDERAQRLAWDTIVYARGELAVPYQIELFRQTYLKGPKLRHHWEYHRPFEMFRNIESVGDVKTALLLLSLAKEPFFGSIRTASVEDVPGLWRFLDHTIRQMHQNGVEELRVATHEYVQNIPKADPVYVSLYATEPRWGNDDY